MFRTGNQFSDHFFGQFRGRQGSHTTLLGTTTTDSCLGGDGSSSSSGAFLWHDGMMCRCFFVRLFLCLFEMQRDDGIAMPKLGQIAIGFGHIDFHNVHHFLTKRNVLNVGRFKVRTAVSLALVHDFTQQIRHAIPHHDTACDIRVHVQRSRGFTHDGTKRHVQVDETPAATHAQVQIVALIHHPKLRVARTVGEIVLVTSERQGGDLILQEGLL